MNKSNIPQDSTNNLKKNTKDKKLASALKKNIARRKLSQKSKLKN